MRRCRLPTGRDRGPYDPPMLVLFDIDGTMLTTQRAGLHAMQSAGQKLFGEGFSFDGVEFAGRLDPLIWAQLAANNGVEDTRENHERFRTTYRAELEASLNVTHTVSALPGVAELIEALEEAGADLGVVTGNYRETGMLKMRAAGIEPDRLPHQAWGDEGEHRRLLPPLAVRRHEEATGRRLEKVEVVVIGDTPHDIDCAHHSGFRALAVGTGPVTIQDELKACVPDLYAMTLERTEEIAEWILGRRQG